MTNEKDRVDVYSTTGPVQDTSSSSSLLGSLLGQAAIVIRERAWFVFAAMVLFVGALVVAYPRDVTYTSSAIFMAESQRTTSPVTTIAAQIGISTPLQGSTTSPQFYLELIRTPRFLESVVDSRQPSSNAGDSTIRTVAEMLGFGSGDRQMARFNAVTALSNSLVASLMGTTGMVRIAVTASSPQLAKGVADVLLAKIQEFNLRTRQSRATAERQFVEGRVAEVSAQLRDAEDRAQRFLAQNRDFSRAPDLQFQYVRLQREISLRQTLFASLSQSFEQARIDEVRDTPVITIVSPPEAPLFRDPLGRLRLLAFSLLFALGAGLVAANIRHQLRTDKGVDGSEQMELMRLTRELREDLRQLRIRQVVLGRPRTVDAASDNGDPGSHSTQAVAESTEHRSSSS